jgi:hypothetical protein
LLVEDAPGVPWVVLTDEPDEFEGLGVRAIRHVPAGPMAMVFLTKVPGTGNGRGGPLNVCHAGFSMTRWTITPS